MYLPRSFRVEDLAALHALIRTHSFGTLVSSSGGVPEATHLPFMIDAERGPLGTLVGHFARANRHWRHFEEGREALVVFQGPHAYISPAWYRDQTTVPTWNYAVVHARGRPVLIHDPAPLREMVLRLVSVHERPGSEWDVAQAEPVMEAELKAIVGFEIEIETIEGKYKFNQNRSREDQAGVAEHLGRSEDPVERAVAAIMTGNLESSADGAKGRAT